MEIENNLNTGDGAPLTVPNTEEEEQEYRVVDEESSLDDTKADQDQEPNADKEQNADKEPNIDDDPDSKEETASKEEDPNDNSKDEDKQNSEKKKDRPKQKFSGAARKRYRFFLGVGYSPEEAREKAIAPVGPRGSKRSGSRDRDRDSKKTKNEVKICIVLDKFPEELLTPEQSKSVQEAITDQILEMGSAGTTKPKFNSSTHETGFLAIICADQTTVDWLKNITPTLKPWEEAALKALTDDEMPHPETFVGFLPDSKDYSDEKILKLLDAQNENFNVSTWKVIKRQQVESELELSFSIDRKYTDALRKAGYKINYKFGQVELWPKDRKTTAERAGSSRDSTSRSSDKEWKLVIHKPKEASRSYKESSSRSSSYRDAPRRYQRGGSNRGSSGFRGGTDRPLRPWETSSYRSGRDQPNWFANSWNPWKK